MEKADEDGVAAFLEATASGMPVYKRYGFEEKGSFTIDMRDKDVVDDEYLEVFMVREPKEN